MNVGELRAVLRLDTGEFDRRVDGARQRLNRVGNSMVSVGKKASLLATAPILLGFSKMVNAAGDLNESVNAVNVVFGTASTKISRFAKVAAQEAGLSARQLNELVTPLGAALQNVGFSADDAAEASISLAKRAADMASVFNVDVEEAMTAIQAGLRGQADPLEKFGVGLTAAAVDAHALELGLADTTGELDDNAKMQARLSLIMKQTERVSGDFKNTSDQVANAQRIATAEVENLSAKLGEKLLPVKQRVIGVASDLLDRFNKLSPSTQNATLAIAGAAAAIGPLLIVGGTLIKTVSSLIGVVKGLQVALAFLAANPIVLVAGAIAVLVRGLIYAYQNSETFRRVVNAAFDAVKGAALKTAEVAVGAFGWLVDKWLWQAETIVGAAAHAFGWVPGLGPKLQGAADKVSAFRDDANTALNAIKDTIGIKIDQRGLVDQIQAANRHIANLATHDRTIQIRYAMSGAGIRTGQGDGPGMGAPNVGGKAAARAAAAAVGLPVRKTSGYRTPARNRAVGGSPTSYHLDKSNPATDWGGPAWALDLFAARLQQMGRWRELLWRTKGHYDHLHVAHRGGVATASGIVPLRRDELLTKLQVGETVIPNNWPAGGVARGGDGAAADPRLLAALGRIERKLDRLTAIERNTELLDDLSQGVGQIPAEIRRQACRREAQYRTR